MDNDELKSIGAIGVNWSYNYKLKIAVINGITVYTIQTKQNIPLSS